MTSAAKPEPASFAVSELRLRWSLPAALAVAGLLAVLAQIVLMREFLVVSHGNELSLGTLLAFWLLWTAAGSAGLGRWPRTSVSLGFLAALLGAVAIAFPVSVLLMRSGRQWWNAAPGEALGPLPILVVAVVTLAPFCLLSGWVYATGAHTYAHVRQASSAESGNRAYLLETVGAAAGGLLASLLLLPYFGSLQICVFAAAAALLATLPLIVRSAILRWALSGVLVACALLGIRYAGRQERNAAAHLWPGFQILDTRNSYYGNLILVENEGNRSVIQNGVTLFTVPDPSTAEESVHFALLEHPDPRKVLLIGGGMNGSIGEILKYPAIERMDYVEVDPALLQLGRQYFPQQWAGTTADARVHVHEMDGRLFVKTSPLRFDVIILNLPEPQTAQLNRFYTEEFYREAASRLAEGGVLAFQLRASEEYISPELADFLRCVYETVGRVFRDVVVIPGESVHFLASTSPGVVSTDAALLLRRLRERQVHTAYLREYYLPFRMSQRRVEELEMLLKSNTPRRVNRDLSPSAYFFNLALWSTQFSEASGGFLSRAAAVPFRWIGATLATLTLILALILRLKGRPQRRLAALAGYAALTAGLTLIGTQVMLLLGFQAIYGHVFHQLALIVAGFMAGAALGNWRGTRAALGSGDMICDRDLRQMLILQFVLAVLPIVLVAALAGMNGIHSSLLQRALPVLFPLLAAFCGAAGGYQFAVAMRVMVAGRGGSPSSPGVLYGLDLAGACIGAIAISAYLLPVFGFLAVAQVTAIANAGPVLLLLASRRETGPSV